MDTYYTIEEKYLQAVDYLSYGDTPKALNLLNTIIAKDATFARAHHQLGKIYYYDIQDYQTAGYHFKTCVQLDPSFPDNYFHYLSLVVFLKMDKHVAAVSEQCLAIPGVDATSIYELLGLHAEQSKQWSKALEAYRNAYQEATDKTQRDENREAMIRIQQKMARSAAYQYTLSG